jgi:hypothetical protein
LDAVTGAFVWSYTTGWNVESSPAVADGRVYIGSDEFQSYGKVCCLNATTGAWIWEYVTGAHFDASPAVANGRVYIGSMDKKMYCLDAATGASIWNFTAGGRFWSSPAVAGGRVYVGSDNNKVMAHGLWDVPGDNKLYCLDAATGAHVWSYTTGDSVLSSPAVADGKVYVGSMDGKVYCFGWPSPGTTPATTPSPSPSPTPSPFPSPTSAPTVTPTPRPTTGNYPTQQLTIKRSPTPTGGPYLEWILFAGIAAAAVSIGIAGYALRRLKMKLELAGEDAPLPSHNCLLLSTAHE